LVNEVGHQLDASDQPKLFASLVWPGQRFSEAAAIIQNKKGEV
jgi:hypothetical protein